jgi:hypothetical protein
VTRTRDPWFLLGEISCQNRSPEGTVTSKPLSYKCIQKTLPGLFVPEVEGPILSFSEEKTGSKRNCRWWHQAFFEILPLFDAWDADGRMGTKRALHSSWHRLIMVDHGFLRRGGNHDWVTRLKQSKTKMTQNVEWKNASRFLKVSTYLVGVWIKFPRTSFRPRWNNIQRFPTVRWKHADIIWRINRCIPAIPHCKTTEGG